jgi:hypothetical protein
MSTRNFNCPVTESRCERDDCTLRRCVAKELEHARIQEAEARAEEERWRQRIDPVTGQRYVRIRPEELGLAPDKPKDSD